jgi:hypothetical protein
LAIRRKFLIQFFAQLAVGAKETHGHVRNTQLVGHFLGGVVQYIHQETHLAQIGRQLRDGGCQHTAGFLAKEALLRIGFP